MRPQRRSSSGPGTPLHHVPGSRRRPPPGAAAVPTRNSVSAPRSPAAAAPSIPPCPSPSTPARHGRKRPQRGCQSPDHARTGGGPAQTGRSRRRLPQEMPQEKPQGLTQEMLQPLRGSLGRLGTPGVTLAALGALSPAGRDYGSEQGPHPPAYSNCCATFTAARFTHRALDPAAVTSASPAPRHWTGLPVPRNRLA